MENKHQGLVWSPDPYMVLCDFSVGALPLLRWRVSGGNLDPKEPYPRRDGT